MDGDRTINRIITTIDWKKIKSYHKKLGIVWEFIEESGETIQRTPNVSELRSELISLLQHLQNEKLNYISHGNWIIFTDNGDIRVIFRLADFHIENDDNPEKLKAALQEAIDSENYEYAAVLRDTLQKRQKDKWQDRQI
ncbi:hypothetical protein EBU94_00230 [bacterium]|nr:hypothetical protein [bacterium]